MEDATVLLFVSVCRDWSWSGNSRTYHHEPSSWQPLWVVKKFPDLMFFFNVLDQPHFWG
jgi:hypothetical protein